MRHHTFYEKIRALGPPKISTLKNRRLVHGYLPPATGSPGLPPPNPPGSQWTTRDTKGWLCGK